MSIRMGWDGWRWRMWSWKLDGRRQLELAEARSRDMRSPSGLCLPAVILPQHSSYP